MLDYIMYVLYDRRLNMNFVPMVLSFINIT